MRVNIFDDFIDDLNLGLRVIDEKLCLEEDLSDYVYVDGEEGDYGKVYYYDYYGSLLATKHIYGGDSYEWEWSYEFKQKAIPIVLNMVKNKIKEL